MTEGTKKPVVLVLMPYSKKFDDVYDLGIKAACELAGAECQRVDEQIHSQIILERIYRQINEAYLIVADITGGNPNVFYETGIAHGLGKLVILLRMGDAQVPFDLQPLPHIIYRQGAIANLKKELQQKVQWYINDPSARTGPFGQAISNEELERMSKKILNYMDGNSYKDVRFESVRKYVDPQYSDAALMTLIDRLPDQFRRVTFRDKKPGIKNLKFES